MPYEPTTTSNRTWKVANCNIASNLKRNAVKTLTEAAVKVETG